MPPTTSLMTVRKSAAQRAVLAAEAREASRVIENSSGNIALGLIYAYADFADEMETRIDLMEKGTENDLGLPVVFTRAKGRADGEREVGFDLRALSVKESLMDVRNGGDFKLTVAWLIAIIDGLGGDTHAWLVVDVGKEIESNGSPDAKSALAGSGAEDGVEVIQLGNALGVTNISSRTSPVRQSDLRLKPHRIFPRFDEPRYIENPRLGRGNERRKKDKDSKKFQARSDLFHPPTLAKLSGEIK